MAAYGPLRFNRRTTRALRPAPPPPPPRECLNRIAGFSRCVIYNLLHPNYRQGRGGLRCPLHPLRNHTQLALGCNKDDSIETQEMATNCCCLVPYNRFLATFLVTIIVHQSCLNATRVRTVCEALS